MNDIGLPMDELSCKTFVTPMIGLQRKLTLRTSDVSLVDNHFIRDCHKDVFKIDNVGILRMTGEVSAKLII